MITKVFKDFKEVRESCSICLNIYIKNRLNRKQSGGDFVPPQRLVLHSFDSVSSPLQYPPPYIGAGLTQYRLRICNPVPQGWLHRRQLPQAPQLPSTKDRNYI